jgi:hypothetical protein
VRLTIPVTVQVPLYGEAEAAASLKQYEQAWAAGRVQDAIRRVLDREALQYYRELVLAALPRILEPEVMNRAKAPLLEGTGALRQALKARDAMQANGASPEALERANVRVRRAMQAVVKQVEARNSGDLATGKFRERANAVLKLLTDPNQIAIWRDQAGVVFWGVGRLKDLQVTGLRVPSWETFRPRKQGRGRTYPRAFMWKQLEQGAGAGSGSNRSGSGWYFGGLGITRVRGTKGFPKVLARVNSDAVQQQLITRVLQVVTNG